MPWPKIGAAYYHAQLGLPGKDLVIKVVVCWVLLHLITWVFGQKNEKLAPHSHPWLLDLTDVKVS